MRRTNSRAFYHAGLAVVMAAVGAALIAAGIRHHIDYDSAWHVFIARQDRWPNFWREVFDNAHPPLFYLLLRAASWTFGKHLLAYRAVSIAATMAGAGLMGAVVRRITANRALAVVAAAAYGLSSSAFIIGLEVRSYALCAFFTLAAFALYLDWLKTPGHRLTRRTYAGFAAMATGAVLSHYSTFFFLAALIATPVILAAVDRGWRGRLRAKVSSRPVATLVMFAIPVAAAGIAYYVHVVLWAGGRLNHVPTYMFEPGGETAFAFLRRNTINLAGLLLPGGDDFPFNSWRQWMSLAVVGTVWAAGLSRIGRARTPRLTVVPLLVFAIMVALNAATGLARRYPFGGTGRHEFFLVAFAVAVSFGLFEAARRMAARRWRSWSAAAAGCSVAAGMAMWIAAFEIVPEQWYFPQMQRFRQVVPSPEAVLVDQFTFINFFAHQHDWEWSLGSEFGNQPVRQVWWLRRGDRRFAVCRGVEWSMDMLSDTTYSTLAECLTKAGVRRVALFQTEWELQRPKWDTSKTAQVVDGLSGAHELKPIVFDSNGGNVNAEFADACRPPSPPKGLAVVSNRGGTVELSWNDSAIPRSSYIVEAGRSPGSMEALRKDVGTATSFKTAAVPPATYYARVRVRNRCGTGDPSNEVAVVVP